MASQLFLIALLVASVSPAFASDPCMLQDFCVADKTSPVLVNGFACKDPMAVTAEEFSFSGLHVAANTSNNQGSAVTGVNVAQIVGLNTLGVSLVRIDFAPFGQNPPRIHPRATEILTVLEGSLSVGFVISNPDNKLFAKVLNKGDAFVFPQGSIHFQFNYGTNTVVAIAALSSMNPGVITIANVMFVSNPNISGDIIAKAF